MTGFASGNGWTIVDSAMYKAGRQELENEQPSITVQIEPFKPSLDNNFLDYSSPRWTNTSLTLTDAKPAG